MPSWKKLIVSGSDASLASLTTTGKLQLNSSETGSTIFEVNGVNGRLFTITDEMSGSLFNISTTAGLPVIEALSDGKITLGPFSNQTKIDTSGNLELGGNISGSATSTGSFGSLVVSDKVQGNLEIDGILTIPGISNLSSSVAAAIAGGDNLGNHTATEDINLDGNALTNVSTLTSTGNISGSATSTGSFGRVEADTEVLTPMLTFDSHTSTNHNINVKSGSTSIRVSENFLVGADSTINIEDDGRLILVPPSFFIT